MNDLIPCCGQTTSTYGVIIATRSKIRYIVDDLVVILLLGMADGGSMRSLRSLRSLWYVPMRDLPYCLGAKHSLKHQASHQSIDSIRLALGSGVNLVLVLVLACTSQTRD